MYTAEYFIKTLKLIPHIEGGFYREIYRTEKTVAVAGGKERTLSTTIYFLLPGREVSRFHRLSSDELWFFHYGSPLVIHTFDENGRYAAPMLGLDCPAGMMPQITIPAGTIFGAENGDKESFSLVSCMVSPGFDFEDFELIDTATLCGNYQEKRKLFERFENGGEC